MRPDATSDDAPRRDAPPGAVPRHLGRRDRLAVVLERDGSSCVWCGRPLEVGLVVATTEHLVPRTKGGPSWLENEVAACRRCNSARGHATPAEWIDECRRRGWSPRPDVVVRVLESLRAAIAARGGQRRARPYVDAQLRRLGPALPPRKDRRSVRSHDAL